MTYLRSDVKFHRPTYRYIKNLPVYEVSETLLSMFLYILGRSRRGSTASLTDRQSGPLAQSWYEEAGITDSGRKPKTHFNNDMMWCNQFCLLAWCWCGEKAQMAGTSKTAGWWWPSLPFRQSQPLAVCFQPSIDPPSSSSSIPPPPPPLHILTPRLCLKHSSHTPPSLHAFISKSNIPR